MIVTKRTCFLFAVLLSSVFLGHFVNNYFDPLGYRTVYRVTASLDFCTSNKNVSALVNSTPLVNPVVFFDQELFSQKIVDIYFSGISELGEGIYVEIVVEGRDSVFLRYIVEEVSSRYVNWDLVRATLTISDIQLLMTTQNISPDLLVFGLKSVSLFLNYCMLFGMIGWLVSCKRGNSELKSPTLNESLVTLKATSPK